MIRIKKGLNEKIKLRPKRISLIDRMAFMHLNDSGDLVEPREEGEIVDE